MLVKIPKTLYNYMAIYIVIECAYTSSFQVLAKLAFLFPFPKSLTLFYYLSLNNLLLTLWNVSISYSLLHEI